MKRLETINVTLQRELNRYARVNDKEGLKEYILNNLPLPKIIELCSELYQDVYEKKPKIRISRDEMMQHFTIINPRRPNQGMDADDELEFEEED